MTNLEESEQVCPPSSWEVMAVWGETRLCSDSQKGEMVEMHLLGSLLSLILLHINQKLPYEC
jgi:hypothetical protein